MMKSMGIEVDRKVDYVYEDPDLDELNKILGKFD